MKYTIEFSDDRHPPEEVQCREGTLRILSARQLKADTETLIFPADIRQITDEDGVIFWSVTGG